MGIVHFFCAYVYGRLGVLLAYSPSSLGRVPEQILQRSRIQVRTLLLQTDLKRVHWSLNSLKNLGALII